MEHRIIYAVVTGRDAGNLHVHHIDGCRDNNNFYNLQALTKSEHSSVHRGLDSLYDLKPLSPTRPTTKPGVKGINWRKDRNTFEVRVTINGRRRTIGYCKTLEEGIQLKESWLANNKL